MRVFGCLSDYRWCDVSYGPNRGWVYAGFLSYTYQNRPVVIYQSGSVIGFPIITFSIGTYWDTYYRGRPWYRDRSRYYNWRPPPARPYRPPPPVSRPPSRPVNRPTPLPSPGGRPPSGGKPGTNPPPNRGSGRRQPLRLRGREIAPLSPRIRAAGLSRVAELPLAAGLHQAADLERIHRRVILVGSLQLGRVRRPGPINHRTKEQSRLPAKGATRKCANVARSAGLCNHRIVWIVIGFASP